MTDNDLFDSSAHAAERRGCHAPPSSGGHEGGARCDSGDYRGLPVHRTLVSFG
jgi:hypothetical protein